MYTITIAVIIELTKDLIIRKQSKAKHRRINVGIYFVKPSLYIWIFYDIRII